MNNKSRRYMDFAPRRGGELPVVVKKEERTVRVSEGPRPIKVRSTTQISVRSVSDKPRRVMTMPKKRSSVARRPVVKKVAVSTPAPRSVAVQSVSVPQSTSFSQSSDLRSSESEAMGMPEEMISELEEAAKRPSMVTSSNMVKFGGDENDEYWGRELGVIEDIDPVSDKEIAEETEVVMAAEEDSRDQKKGLEDNRVGFKEGKSPFINTDKLEKRPLSAFRRGNSRPMPTKNSYAEQVKAAEEKSDVPTMVVTEAGKRSGFSLVIAIIMVTILGALAGLVVYLAFFQ